MTNRRRSATTRSVPAQTSEQLLELTQEHRDGNRYDGEADLLRAHERRGDPVAPLFKITKDVLEHDDRVIHDKTDRKRKRHQ